MAVTDLGKLKLLTGEQDADDGAQGGCDCAPAQSARMFTDAQLMEYLDLHDGHVEAAAYTILLRKAENSEIRLPNGLTLPNQRAYWLSLAKNVRPNKTRAGKRADDPRPERRH